MNEVNETIRAIDASIGHHKKKIRQLNDAKKEIMDKYNIPYTKKGGLNLHEYSKR